jgi:protein-tyrosine kinase
MSRIYDALQRAVPPDSRNVIENGTQDAAETDVNAPLELVHRETDETRADRNQFRLFAAGIEPGPGDNERSGLVISGKAQEQMVKLVSRVFVLPNSHAPRLVLFSSIDSNTSSAEMCIHAGQILAEQASARVCLVDANFQRPSLHELLKIHKGPGLVEALNNERPIADYTTRVSGANVWIVPAGSSRAVLSAGQFSSSRMRLLLSDLRKQFGHVLINAPPVTSAAHTALLGQLADGVILVIEANSTRRDAARTAKELLATANVKLLGAILNKHSSTLPEALFKRRS